MNRKTYRTQNVINTQQAWTCRRKWYNSTRLAFRSMGWNIIIKCKQWNIDLQIFSGLTKKVHIVLIFFLEEKIKAVQVTRSEAFSSFNADW